MSMSWFDYEIYDTKISGPLKLEVHNVPAHIPQRDPTIEELIESGWLSQDSKDWSERPEVKAVQEHAVAEPVNDNPFLQTKPTFVQPTIAPTKPVEPEVPSQYGPPTGVNLNDDRTVQLVRGDAKARYLEEMKNAGKNNPAVAAHLIKGINVENIALINDDKSAVMIRSTLN